MGNHKHDLKAWPGARKPKAPSEAVKVIFRKYPDGEVIALFPYMMAVDGTPFCTTYLHVGQHGDGTYSWIVESTVPATEAEYADLKKELTEIGYQLEVRTRRNSKFLLKAYGMKRFFREDESSLSREPFING